MLKLECLFGKDFIRWILLKVWYLFPSEREYISEDIIFHMQYLIKAQCVVIEETPNYYYCDNGISLTKVIKQIVSEWKNTVEERNTGIGSDIWTRSIQAAII